MTLSTLSRLSSVLLLTYILPPQNQQVLFTVQVASRFSLAEPVVINLGVANDGPQPLEVNFGGANAERFEFELTRPGGSTDTIRPLGRNGVDDTGVRHLEPGGRHESWIVLDEWTQIPASGSYRLVIRFSGTVRTPGGAVAVPRVFRYAFDVTPRNQEALTEAAVRLGQLAENFQTETKAILALSYLRDPVAVPYLQRYAQSRPWPSTAIKGLERIGGPEARAALGTLSQHSDPLTASIAKASLLMIK
jgi:hypothetical protein